MLRLQCLSDHDAARKQLRLGLGEGASAVAAVHAVESWLDESGVASASLTIGNRSYALLGRGLGTPGVEAGFQGRTVATISALMRSARGAVDSTILLGRICEILGRTLGFERAGIARNVASHDPPDAIVAARLAALVRGVAAGRADEIELHIDPELLMDGNANAFDRIVSNLITKALRYRRRPIVVSASRQDRHFRLAAEDCGPGVSPELEAQLFDRFTRGDNAAKTGTGLGLSIARSYARAHGGELVYARATPHGARFEFVVPTASR